MRTIGCVSYLNAKPLIDGLDLEPRVRVTTAGSDLGGLPARLRQRRLANCSRIAEIAERHAPSAGWPTELAKHYLGRLLSYGLGDRELEAMTTFWARCQERGLIERVKPLALYEGPKS